MNLKVSLLNATFLVLSISILLFAWNLMDLKDKYEKIEVQIARLEGLTCSIN